MRACLLLAVVGLAAVEGANNGAVVAPTTTQYEFKTMSTTYQLGSYPYLAIKDATGKAVVPAVVASVDECKALCKNTPFCKYGTFVTAESKMEAANHDYSQKARKGECWLSAQTHSHKTKCGVACVSFEKVALTPAELQAARAKLDQLKNPNKQLEYTTLLDANGKYNGISALVTAIAAKKFKCHSTGKDCTMSCRCDPFTHPSAFTKCKIDPFNQKVKVYHLDPKFHTRPFHPTTQHHCAYKTGKGCSCCSCDSVVGTHSFVGVGIGRHLVDVNAGIIKSPQGDFFVADNLEACERLCSEQSYAPASTPAHTGAGNIENVEGSRLDCQARCDTNPACEFIHVENNNCKLLTAKAFDANLKQPGDKDITGGTILKKLGESERCNGGTFMGGKTVNNGKCFLATTLISEQVCLQDPQQCTCSQEMGCSSFRRRPSQFHQSTDVFHGDPASAQVRNTANCASIINELCYDYQGCFARHGNYRGPCGNTLKDSPEWMQNGARFVEGDNQCCGAGLECQKEGTPGDMTKVARCVPAGSAKK